MDDRQNRTLSPLVLPERFLQEPPTTPTSPIETWYPPPPSPHFPPKQLLNQNEYSPKATPVSVTNTGKQHLNTMVDVLKENRVAHPVSTDLQREMVHGMKTFDELLDKDEAQDCQSPHSQLSAATTPKTWSTSPISESLFSKIISPTAGVDTHKLNIMMDMLSENRLGQLASMDQQREIMYDIRKLNERLDRIEAQDRQPSRSPFSSPATPRIWPTSLKPEESLPVRYDGYNTVSAYMPPMFGGLGGVPLSVIPESPPPIVSGPSSLHASIPPPPSSFYDTSTPFIPPLPSPEGSPQLRHPGVVPPWASNFNGNRPPITVMPQSPFPTSYLNPYMATPYIPSMSQLYSPLGGFVPVPGSYFASPVALPGPPIGSVQLGPNGLPADYVGFELANPTMVSPASAASYGQPPAATPLVTPPMLPDSQPFLVERTDARTSVSLGALPAGFVPTNFMSTPPVNAMGMLNMGTPYTFQPHSSHATPSSMVLTPPQLPVPNNLFTGSRWVWDPNNPMMAVAQMQVQAQVAASVASAAAAEAVTAATQPQQQESTQTQAAATAPQPLSRPRSTYWCGFPAEREPTAKIGCFASGPHYGPVLTPFLAALVKPRVQINPFLRAKSENDVGALLKWDMLWPFSDHLRLDESLKDSWTRCCNEPATFPRLTSLCIISRAFPWSIYIMATDVTIGVTCGDMIDGLSDHFHTVAGEIFDNASTKEKNNVMAAYHLNCYSMHNSPYQRLEKVIRLVDWLGKDTVFGGIDCNKALVTQGNRKSPILFELQCHTRKQPTDNKAEEQSSLEV